jgi:hypothetical protein
MKKCWPYIGIGLWYLLYGCGMLGQLIRGYDVYDIILSDQEHSK